MKITDTDRLNWIEQFFTVDEISYFHYGRGIVDHLELDIDFDGLLQGLTPEHENDTFRELIDRQIEAERAEELKNNKK